MNCHEHTETNAVAQCPHCGRGLCQVCSSLFSSPICKNCFKLQLNNNRKVYIRNLIISAVLFYFGFRHAYETFNDSNIFYTLFMSLIGGYILAGVPWGWSSLSRLTADIFLFMPLIGWVFYFFIKFIISCFVGIFITPFKLYASIKGLIDVSKNKQYLESIH